MDSPQAPTLAVPRDVIGSRHYAVGVPEFQNGSLRHDALNGRSVRCRESSAGRLIDLSHINARICLAR